ncbi:uncharacterized protein JCM15063_003946 [Sporobolomyces koalae]|uniref:uncharacterized protein n=1 Tax=Sporobolomyces koalae TaxID=500713 RepID=UPI003180F84B
MPQVQVKHKLKVFAAAYALWVTRPDGKTTIKFGSIYQLVRERHPRAASTSDEHLKVAKNVLVEDGALSVSSGPYWTMSATVVEGIESWKEREEVDVGDDEQAVARFLRSGPKTSRNKPSAGSIVKSEPKPKVNPTVKTAGSVSAAAQKRKERDDESDELSELDDSEREPEEQDQEDKGAEVAEYRRSIKRVVAKPRLKNRTVRPSKKPKIQAHSATIGSGSRTGTGSADTKLWKLKKDELVNTVRRLEAELQALQAGSGQSSSVAGDVAPTHEDDMKEAEFDASNEKQKMDENEGEPSTDDVDRRSSHCLKDDSPEILETQSSAARSGTQAGLSDGLPSHRENHISSAPRETIAPELPVPLSSLPPLPRIHTNLQDSVSMPKDVESKRNNTHVPTAQAASLLEGLLPLQSRNGQANGDDASEPPDDEPHRKTSIVTRHVP